MITNFKTFGLEHILAIIIAIVIGLVFIILAKKYPDKKKTISIILAIIIVIIRCVRYGFDIYLQEFKLTDLIALHVCHINLILLAICLFKPNKTIFTFNFLIGIPTALSVVLMPGSIHPAPGMLRAIFFIMSHAMLVMGAIYLLIIYRFKITKKDLLNYYIISFIIMLIIYIFNLLAKTNFMYLNAGPEGTILESMDNFLGPFWYIVSIYILMIILLTILYFIYNLVYKYLEKNKKIIF